MIKANIQNFINTIDIKNTRLSDKNGVKSMSYIFSKKNLCKEMSFSNFQIGIRINKI